MGIIANIIKTSDFHKPEVQNENSISMTKIAIAYSYNCLTRLCKNIIP